MGNLLFERADPPLQLEIRGTRLQVGIGLCREEKAADGAGQLVFGGKPRRIRLTAAPGTRAQRRHLFEEIALVRAVALDDVDQLRQLIMPLAQQDIDVRPCLLDLMLDADQAVVD